MPDNQLNPNANPGPDAADDDVIEFETVDGTFQIKGGSLRMEPYGTVTTTGNCRFNTTGSENLDEVGHGHALKPGAYEVTYGVNLQRNAVVVTPVRPGTPGAMPVRRSNDKQLSIHLGGVFEKYPQLRPISTSDCLVAIRKNTKGQPVLMIALQSAQHKSKTRSSGTGSASK